MSRKVSTINNKDKLTELGLAIAAIRRHRGFSQQELAERSNISRSYLCTIESANLECNFTMDAFLSIAVALSIEPQDVFDWAVFSEKVLDE